MNSIVYKSNKIFQIERSKFNWSKLDAQTDVDIVEKYNLLQRIRDERRDLNCKLADLSVRKSQLENNVDEVNEPVSDEQDEEEDTEEVGTADTQDLDDKRADQNNRIHDLLF